MGDIVHTMPTAVAIKRSHPEWKLDWVVQKNFAGLLRAHPAVDQLIEIPRRPSRSDLAALKTRIRGIYDVALDMQGLYKSGRIAALSRAPLRLGYHWQRELSWLFTKAVKPTQGGLHVVDQYLAVAERLGAQHAPPDFQLRPSPPALKSAEKMFSDLRLEGRPVAINLGAGKPEKCWPLPRFAELVELLRRGGWAPFLIGGPADEVRGAELESLAGAGVPNLIGETSIEELVAVLSLVDAHVGGDTGSIHIAVALGRPVVAIMGPTDPDRSGPYGRRESVLYEGQRGLAGITAESVADRLERAANAGIQG
jgi:lipopolysaccharide heptosyltransferase I